MMHPRIAVLGCGYWGKNLVRNFHELGALGMVCDPAEAGRAAARQFAPGVRVGEDFEDALAAEGITAVAIAARAAMHYPLAQAALEAGKKSFVGKTLCPDRHDA